MDMTPGTTQNMVAKYKILDIILSLASKHNSKEGLKSKSIPTSRDGLRALDNNQPRLEELSVTG